MTKHLLTITAMAALALTLCQCDKIRLPGAKPAANYATTVALTLTPAALAKLTAVKDQVAIEATYYAYPNHDNTAKADNLGQISLGDDKLSVDPTAKTVPMPGTGLDTKSLPETSGDPVVLFSAYSITIDGAQDELLECSNARGAISKFQAGPAQITCDVAPPSPAS